MLEHRQQPRSIGFDKEMTPTQHAYLCALLHRFFADRPKQEAADWCCESLRFNEPDNHGPFSLFGNEYSRDPINDWADPLVTDQVLVWASQTKKTGGIMGGAAWTVFNEPSRIKWVMPTRDLVRGFSRNRWMKMCEASAEMAGMIPKGAKRHDFSTLSQILGGSIIDFAWSNSPSALSSDPCRIVILDEVDKFNEGGNGEANAVNLAEQRTKSFANPKRIKTSTPTLVTGLIWQEFLKTDQRRRFMPCPHCGKFVVLIWSKSYTVFKLTGEEAEVRWDKAAKKADGWDMDRVEASAHYACPHCAGKILDAHKTAMDRQGVWRPTAVAARGYRGYHLPVMYSSSAEANVGKLAVKFLQAKASLLGLQGFINGELAEPYMAQDTLSERVELVTSRMEVTAEWIKVMTVDCQATTPLFYAVIRAWNGKGGSAGLKAITANSWEEIADIQKAEKIPDVAVLLDSGFGATGEDGVYRNCVKRCELVPNRKKTPPGHPFILNDAIGWTPMKGMPGHKRWRDRESGLYLPYMKVDQDPYHGTSLAGRVALGVLEFSGDFFKDILDGMRKGKGVGKWSVIDEMAKDEEYWRQMSAEHKSMAFSTKTGKTSYTWVRRSSHWPNHWFDCEVMQVAGANFFGWLTIDEKSKDA